MRVNRLSFELRYAGIFVGEKVNFIQTFDGNENKNK